MAVASPRLFLALCLFLSPSPSHRLCVSPCLSSPLPPVLTRRPHRTLRPSSCTESVPHTTFAYVYADTRIHLYTSAYMHMHTYTRAKCIPRCFRSLCVPSFDPFLLLLLLLLFIRSVPSSLLFVPLTGYHIRVSRSENSSVGPE